MSAQLPSPESIKSIITNAREPLIIRNCLKWDILNWSLLKWNEILKNEELQTRCGRNLPTPVSLYSSKDFSLLARSLRSLSGKVQQKLLNVHLRNS